MSNSNPISPRLFTEEPATPDFSFLGPYATELEIDSWRSMVSAAQRTEAIRSVCLRDDSEKLLEITGHNPSSEALTQDPPSAESSSQTRKRKRQNVTRQNRNLGEMEERTFEKTRKLDQEQKAAQAAVNARIARNRELSDETLNSISIARQTDPIGADIQWEDSSENLFPPHLPYLHRTGLPGNDFQENSSAPLAQTESSHSMPSPLNHTVAHLPQSTFSPDSFPSDSFNFMNERLGSMVPCNLQQKLILDPFRPNFVPPPDEQIIRNQETSQEASRPLNAAQETNSIDDDILWIANSPKDLGSSSSSWNESPKQTAAPLPQAASLCFVPPSDEQIIRNQETSQEASKPLNAADASLCFVPPSDEQIIRNQETSQEASRPLNAAQETNPMDDDILWIANSPKDLDPSSSSWNESPRQTAAPLPHSPFPYIPPNRPQPPPQSYNAHHPEPQQTSSTKSDCLTRTLTLTEYLNSFPRNRPSETSYTASRIMSQESPAAPLPHSPFPYIPPNRPQPPPQSYNAHHPESQQTSGTESDCLTRTLTLTEYLNSFPRNRPSETSYTASRIVPREPIPDPLPHLPFPYIPPNRPQPPLQPYQVHPTRSQTSENETYPPTVERRHEAPLAPREEPPRPNLRGFLSQTPLSRPGDWQRLRD